MTFVQQLLVAPAALGLLAPLAVVNRPAAQATELNINGVSDYAASASGNSLDQVTSVTQFADVVPHRLGLSGSGQPGGNLRLRRRLPQRQLPWQPGHDPLRSGCPAERLPRPDH